jgi:hypothetical protein
MAIFPVRFMVLCLGCVSKVCCVDEWFESASDARPIYDGISTRNLVAYNVMIHAADILIHHKEYQGGPSRTRGLDDWSFLEICMLTPIR